MEASNGRGQKRALSADQNWAVAL